MSDLTVFILLNKMEGMTFTQDEILEVLAFMMNRMNQENRPFSASHEKGLNEWKILEITNEKCCKGMHFKKGEDNGVQDFWKCDFCDAIIQRVRE